MEVVPPILRLISAIGADIKSLRTGSSMRAINGATRLIQTQRIVANMAAKGTLL